jgi:alginate O-acetyltransferase complex protein AlgI
MLFNSITFLIFLPLVFCAYWLLGKTNRLVYQNLLLLAASYIFYGWWDYRFLALIFASTLVDYVVGLKIYNGKSKQSKKAWLWVSIIFNLGLLGFFKYFNFFIESWVEAFALLNVNINSWTLKVILPVGISFYTFQTMSYALDIYKGSLKPTKNFIGFAAFVSFFPQLVAGPIERASELLPQILKKREFSYPLAVSGLRLALWGFFKKIVIADALAPAVNEIFSNYQAYSSAVLFLGAVYFTFQIYCDFSGYSDIAIGTAKLFGIRLMTNFNFPYFSRGIAECWRRWHISLSTWFRDYVYIPLGGSRVSKPKAIRNIFVVFLVSGFWHGANWTFVFWGLLHSLLFLPSFIIGTNKASFSKWGGGIPSKANFIDLFRILGLFFIIVLSWVIFRAENMIHAMQYLKGILSFSVKGIPLFNPYDYQNMRFENICILIFVLAEMFMVTKIFKLRFRVMRWLSYLAAIVFIMVAIQLNSDSPFIYFQF